MVKKSVGVGKERANELRQRRALNLKISGFEQETATGRRDFTGSDWEQLEQTRSLSKTRR
jgi:hypothetical protein